MENGTAVVRYNPGQLPGLAPRARLFLFAHECTRLAARQTLGDRSIGPARRRADCLALATLQRSGELAAADQALRSFAVELAVAEVDWTVLPGPPRTVDLAACAQPNGDLHLPDGAAPSAVHARMDLCVQGCGDRLWRCRNPCRDDPCRERCLAGYGACDSTCDGRRMLAAIADDSGHGSNDGCRIERACEETSTPPDVPTRMTRRRNTR